MVHDSCESTDTYQEKSRWNRVWSVNTAFKAFIKYPLGAKIRTLGALSCQTGPLGLVLCESQFLTYFPLARKEPLLPWRSFRTLFYHRQLSKQCWDGVSKIVDWANHACLASWQANYRLKNRQRKWVLGTNWQKEGTNKAYTWIWLKRDKWIENE